MVVEMGLKPEKFLAKGDSWVIAEMGVGSREDDSWAETPETAGVVVF